MENDTFRYGLRICYVYGDQKRHELLPAIRKFCDDNYLILTAREYDPEHRSEDSQVITNLPAFHVYYEDGWDDTFYPGDNYIGIIKKHIRKAQEEYERNAALSRWKKFWKTWMPSKRKQMYPKIPSAVSLEFPSENERPYEVRTTLPIQ